MKYLGNKTDKKQITFFSSHSPIYLLRKGEKGRGGGNKDNECSSTMLLLKPKFLQSSPLQIFSTISSEDVNRCL